MQKLLFSFLLFWVSASCLRAQTDTLKIELKTSTITIKVGQITSLSYTVHGSVGIGGVVNASDSTTLKSTGSRFDFERAQMTGMTGGDKATETVFFQALKAGKATLTYKRNFRGKIEKIVKIKVKVRE